MVSTTRKDTLAPGDPRPRWRIAAIVALVWGLAAVPFFSGFAVCPSARFFRFPCPGCGMTRALDLLARGELASSLAMHPLALPTALSQLALAAASIVAASKWGAPWALVRARWGRAAIGVVVLVFALDLLLWLARFGGAFGGPVDV